MLSALVEDAKLDLQALLALLEARHECVVATPECTQNTVLTAHIALEKDVVSELARDDFIGMRTERLDIPCIDRFLLHPILPKSYRSIATTPLFLYKSICTGFLKNFPTRATVKKEGGVYEFCHRTRLHWIGACRHISSLLYRDSISPRSPLT